MINVKEIRAELNLLKFSNISTTAHVRRSMKNRYSVPGTHRATILDVFVKFY